MKITRFNLFNTIDISNNVDLNLKTRHLIYSLSNSHKEYQCLKIIYKETEAIDLRKKFEINSKF